ncbi:unnamed protein product [Lampetra fluviatilis]
MERNSGANFGFSESDFSDLSNMNPSLQYHPWSSVTDEPNATNARPSPSDSEQMSFSGFDTAQESPDMFGMVSNLVNDYEEPSLDTSTSRTTPTYDLTMLWNALNIREAVDPLGRKVCDNLMTPEKTIQNAWWMLQQSFDRPSNELCISIEKCLMNAKALTSEMNMVETKLLKNYSGLYVSSVESSSPVHWLDANHTHINNLIFYQLRENLRLKILFGKMESLCGVSVPDSIMLDLANHLKAVRLVKLWRQEASNICGEGGQTLVGSVMQLFMSIRKLRTSLCRAYMWNTPCRR